MAIGSLVFDAGAAFPSNPQGLAASGTPCASFRNPSAIVLDGADLSVANSGNSVTELDASTGALVRVIWRNSEG